MVKVFFLVSPPKRPQNTSESGAGPPSPGPPGACWELFAQTWADIILSFTALKLSLKLFIAATALLPTRYRKWTGICRSYSFTAFGYK